MWKDEQSECNEIMRIKLESTIDIELIAGNYQMVSQVVYSCMSKTIFNQAIYLWFAKTTSRAVSRLFNDGNKSFRYTRIERVIVLYFKPSTHSVWI